MNYNLSKQFLTDGHLVIKCFNIINTVFVSNGMQGFMSISKVEFLKLK